MAAHIIMKILIVFTSHNDEKLVPFLLEDE